MQPNLPTLSLISGISCGNIDAHESSSFIICSCSGGVGAMIGINGGHGGNLFSLNVGFVMVG
jgi:hypothetical protein